jgi:hypothetical protein
MAKRETMLRGLTISALLVSVATLVCSQRSVGTFHGRLGDLVTTLQELLDLLRHPTVPWPVCSLSLLSLNGRFYERVRAGLAHARQN